jgi:hypothetical protein
MAGRFWWRLAGVAAFISTGDVGANGLGPIANDLEPTT